MWDKNFCSVLFLVIYNQLFLEKNNLQKTPEEPILENLAKEKNTSQNLESEIKNEAKIAKKSKKEILLSELKVTKKQVTKKESDVNPLQDIYGLVNFDDFGFDISQINFEDLQTQFDLWKLRQVDFENRIGSISSNWEKTLITTQSILAVIYLEFCELEKTQETVLLSKLVTKYLKITKEYLDNQNISLIHAIITKIQVSFDLNIEKESTKETEKEKKEIDLETETL